MIDAVKTIKALRLAILLTALLSISLAGCGSPAVVSTQPAPTATISESLRRDAETMARQLGISVEAAIRRINEQDAIGALGAELEQKEADTFAGLWIQHEPEYRVVAAFTRGGQETIKPYIEGASFAGLVEVRAAKASLAELKAAQQKAMQIIRELGFPFSTGINVEKNQVEIYATDRASFETSFRNAGLSLPERVEIVSIYEPLSGDIPFALTPAPDLFLPQLRARSSTFMLALLQGRLTAKEGCLRVSGGDEDAGFLIIWQPDYFLNDNQGNVEVLDREGRVVARVGEQVSLGGGEAPLTTFERQLREPIPGQCQGPYWLMGDVVSR